MESSEHRQFKQKITLSHSEESTSAALTTIIIPCFNRKAITLGCLRRLTDTGASAGFRVLVVDDASTDGTAEAVAQEFPEVEVLHGGGELYWTGAIELGMRHAVSQGASCCVWLNDDLIVVDGAIGSIVELAMRESAMVTAQGVIRLANSELWYFWILLKQQYGLKQLEPTRGSLEPVAVDTCRGNMVAIPRAVIEKIGYPDGYNIPHLAGDSDYGLRATAAGIPCLLLTSAVFFELEVIRTDNHSWLLSDKPVTEIWKAAVSKRGVLYPRMVVVYNLRHWGLRGAVVIVRDFSRLIFIILLKLTVPKWVLHRFFTESSCVQNAYSRETDGKAVG
jgi:GT2 family glycosyltransferase